MAIYCRNGSVLIISGKRYKDNENPLKFLNIVIAYQLYTAHISLLHAVPD